MTKIEWAAQLRKAGIDLPENWGKLSTSRAQAFTEKALAGKPAKGGLGRLAASIGAVAASAMSAAGAMVDTALAVTGMNEAVEALPERSGPPEGYVRKTLPNPGWARYTGGMRGWLRSYPGADPDPITRQVRRQNERRAGKMPIGSRQSIWHDLKGFGKVGAGKKGYVA